jgi:hypothetical protein
MEVAKGEENLWARKSNELDERTMAKDEEHFWVRRKNRIDERKVGKNEEEEVEDNQQNQKRKKIRIWDRRTEKWMKRSPPPPQKCRQCDNVGTELILVRYLECTFLSLSYKLN